ncbi:GNAT family N-acetyltransferase [archaeon]
MIVEEPKKEELPSAFGKNNGIKFYRVQFFHMRSYDRERDGHFKLVAEGKDGEELGYISYEYTPIYAAISDLEVNKERRGKGVGFELCKMAVQHLDQIIEEHPPRNKEISAPLDPNHANVGELGRALKKHGFEEETGEGAYGWVRPPMEKRLSKWHKFVKRWTGGEPGKL